MAPCCGKDRGQVSITISVIMPARNAERYVQEAIQSVLSQKGVRFELLIADDASTDKTWNRIQKYCEDPRVRFWKLRRRRGAAKARNVILRSARGKYIVPFDADDLMLPGYLKTLYGAIHKRPSVGVVFFHQFLQKKGGKILKSRKVFDPDQSWDLLGRGSLGNGGTMIRRSLIERIGGYDVHLPFLQDYDLFLRLAEAARFFCIKGKLLFFYRKRKGTVSDCSARDYKKVFQSIVRKAILRRYQRSVSW